MKWYTKYDKFFGAVLVGWNAGVWVASLQENMGRKARVVGSEAGSVSKCAETHREGFA